MMMMMRRRGRPPEDGRSLCGVCGKVFHGSNQRFLLRRHLLTHTGERRHACPFCSYQANQAGNLNRHIRNLHPTQAPLDAPKAARPLLPILQTSQGAHPPAPPPPPLLGSSATQLSSTRALLQLTPRQSLGMALKPRSPSPRPSLNPSAASLSIHRSSLYFQTTPSVSSKPPASSTTATGAPD